MNKKKTNCLKQMPYGNCKIFDNKGSLLCLSGIKKVNWYLGRGLAEIVFKNEDRTDIKLNFEPAGTTSKKDVFTLSNKENICVVCGVEKELSKHHVIPRCYRSWFPNYLKQHGSHDVLLLCMDCHSSYERKADEIKLKLSEEHNAPFYYGVCKTKMKYNKAISYARSIMQYNYTIPLDRLILMHDYIMDIMKIKNLTDSKIEEIAKTELKDISLESKEVHGKIVVDSLKDKEEFIFFWRKHFVDTMNPQFMPKGWKLDYIYE